MSDTALDLILQNRDRLFAKPGHPYWEVFWNGYDTPADRCPTWGIWDNPIDDDGMAIFAAGGGYLLNTPPGMMTVDRSDPAWRDYPVGSVVSKRDEFLRPEDGFTIEVRVKLHKPTAENGFQIYYRDLNGTCYGLHLSPDKVRGGGYGTRSGPVIEIPFGTMDAFHTYRMVVPPNSRTWKAYINGKFVFQAEANDFRVTSLHIDDVYPTVIVGGEKGNNTTHFTIDYIGYRRGTFPPGPVVPLPRTRKPHPLPPPLPREQWFSWNDAVVHCYPSHIPRPILPFVFKSARPAYNTYVASLDPPVKSKGDYTVEWTVMVESDCEPRGFSSYIRDGMGTLGILWSPDKVELSLGVKNVGWYKDIPIGIRRVPMVTTDRPHKYRIVRPANSLYAHLYIDDKPIPSLYDQHLDASIGQLFDAPMPSLLWGDTLNNWGKGHVTIHGLRWSNTAFAPGINHGMA